MSNLTGNDIDTTEYPAFKNLMVSMLNDMDAVFEDDLNETVKACRMADTWNKHQSNWNSL